MMRIKNKEYKMGFENMYTGQQSLATSQNPLILKAPQNNDMVGLAGLPTAQTNMSADTMMKQMMLQQMQPVQGMKLSDVGSLADFGSWATNPMSGTLGNPGKSPMELGLAGIGAGSQIYSAYNAGKYQDKMAGLAARQQSVYESELAAQNARRDRAQANYDAAQM